MSEKDTIAAQGISFGPSQVPIDRWPDVIGDPTLAILNQRSIAATLIPKLLAASQVTTITGISDRLQLEADHNRRNAQLSLQHCSYLTDSALKSGNSLCACSAYRGSRDAQSRDRHACLERRKVPAGGNRVDPWANLWRF
jgi:hypothetical protein